MKKYKYYFPIFILLLVFSACSENGSGENNENLPMSQGNAGQILVVMDSAQWMGPLGQEIKQTFRQPLPGLPQDEPLFSLMYINPFQMNSMLRRFKNIIYVATLDNNSSAGRSLKSEFTKESVERISQDPDLFMLPKKNVFARDQSVVHIFGNNEEELIANIEENRQALVNHFDQLELSRIKESLYSAKEETGIMEVLEEKHQFSLRIPYGWDLVHNKENFVWIRHLELAEDKNIFIYYTDYTTDSLFTEQNLMAFRDSITSEYLRDVEKNKIYMQTQALFPFHTRQINFNGKFAMESRGMWKLSDNSLGGPFISYTLVDEALNRLYYIEGYVAAPGEDKRKPIKELEVILSTFETSGGESPNI